MTFEGVKTGVYIFYILLGAVLVGGLTVFFYFYDKDRRPVSGRHGLLGQIGRAKQVIPAGKLGKVYIFGEYWEAICDVDLTDNQAIKVIEVHDKFLRVTPTDSLPDRA